MLSNRAMHALPVAECLTHRPGDGVLCHSAQFTGPNELCRLLNVDCVFRIHHSTALTFDLLICNSFFFLIVSHEKNMACS